MKKIFRIIKDWLDNFFHIPRRWNVEQMAKDIDVEYPEMIKIFYNDISTYITIKPKSYKLFDILK